MEKKTATMISLGAAYAAGCIPCFDHLYSVAREEKITDDEVNAIIAIAKKVRSGADVVVTKTIDDFLNNREADPAREPAPNTCPCNC
ncbi:MAG: carboxymuconolactone decarboxylase family protein [Proteobacteria bacterium]|nr:carboxymuconolactone decarboxylase family protein [Desulfobacula sp.]MBU3952663.1 carboxymuconolactone decarboxylase family protein [Pseudomonadota bacterium]MBU4130393.1 carboxymuconolactone decarboxylase family protein [Pseudomonadota bacterium]